MTDLGGTRQRGVGRVDRPFEFLAAIIIKGVLDSINLGFNSVKLLADLDQHRMTSKN